MRTPSESSINLRFSSRVPNRGSRFGVISRAIFKGFYVLQNGKYGLYNAGRISMVPQSASLYHRVRCPNPRMRPANLSVNETTNFPANCTSYAKAASPRRTRRRSAHRKTLKFRGRREARCQDVSNRWAARRDREMELSTKFCIARLARTQIRVNVRTVNFDALVVGEDTGRA